jgi:hypothetical protein
MLWIKIDGLGSLKNYGRVIGALLIKINRFFSSPLISIATDMPNITSNSNTDTYTIWFSSGG